MTKRVVNVLEMIQIQTEHGQLFAALQIFQAPLDVLTQLNTICQARQRIVMRQEGNLFLRMPLLGHVYVYRAPATGA